MKVDAEYKAEVFSRREGETVVNSILLHIYVYKKRVMKNMQSHNDLLSSRGHDNPSVLEFNGSVLMVSLYSQGFIYL